MAKSHCSEERLEALKLESLKPSRLEMILLKLNILNLVGFVNEYTATGSSNLISVGKHTFTDGSWKI